MKQITAELNTKNQFFENTYKITFCKYDQLLKKKAPINKLNKIVQNIDAEEI